MNVVGLREAKAKLAQLGRRAQKGQRALITKKGKPFAVLVGVEGEDLVDVLLRWDPDFWRDIEERRTRSAKSSVPLADVRVDAPKARAARSGKSGRR